MLQKEQVFYGQFIIEGQIKVNEKWGKIKEAEQTN
jgi:hypothetical protein